MNRKLFEKIVEEAVKELPYYFKQKLENVAVIVRSAPGKEHKKRFGKNLLGLYEGIPLSNRGRSYSGVMPDKITIFQKNIEAVCSDKEEIKKEIRHVVMHELAHHFGIDDERLKRKGLY